jgi:phage antirepressor YoqD-like protein
MNDLVNRDPEAGNETPKMTASEVADALNVSPRTVRDNIQRLFPGLAQNGKTTFLDEKQVTSIKQAIEKSGRNDLANVRQVSEVTTPLEIEEMTIKVIAYHKAEADRLRAELTNAAPKIEFFDAVTSSKDAISMKDAAKALNIPGYGRNRLFQYLRDNKIFMDNNTPMQSYIDQGYFRVIEQKYEAAGEIHISLKTVVYQLGLEFIRRKISGR